jgi:hypothetical protein
MNVFKNGCGRCKRNIIQIEEHHLLPKFMDNPHGYSFESYVSRVNLCISCHRALHRIIIIPLLNKFARTLKFIRSEYLLWKKIKDIDKLTVKKETVEASWKFIFNKEFDNGNTRAT